jgi:Kef-type K+ transport system membrane component KefB
MFAAEHTLLILTLILFLGLILPELFKRLKLPSITALIIFGAILGPHGFSWIQSNEVIEFFGFLGFTFLMFMAGLETNLNLLKKSSGKIAMLAICNMSIPFLVGASITSWAGYSMMTSIMIGAIFMSSSVAVISQLTPLIPKIKKHDKHIIISSIVAEDAISLIALAIIFQIASPSMQVIPLPSYLILLLSAVWSIQYLLPKFANYFIQRNFLNPKKEDHEGQVRFVIVLLTFVLLIFSALQVHPILAAFLVGALLSNSVTSHIIHTKFHTLSYGLFIPVFFFISGMEIDLSVFKTFDLNNLTMIYLIVGLLLSKLISGYIGGKIIGLPNNVSKTFGILSMSQLTTTLVATYSAASIGLLDNNLTTTMIILAVVTSIIVPVSLKLTED